MLAEHPTITVKNVSMFKWCRAEWVFTVPRRAAATSIANWAEEQGGIPLFTIEGSTELNNSNGVCRFDSSNQSPDSLIFRTGEEPDSPTASWNLPPLSKHASTANVQSAESLSDDRARTISEGWKQYVALPACLIDRPRTVLAAVRNG